MTDLKQMNCGPVVRAILQGQRDRFGELADRFYSDVYAVALAYTKNRHDAEDAAQDTFLSAFQKLDTLRTPEKFPSWLITIARRTAIARLRKRRPSEPLDTHDIAADGRLPEDTEMDQIVRSTMNTLKPEACEILLLHYFSGLTTPDLAERLDISVESAKKRLQRAREALGAALESEFKDGLDAVRPKRENAKAVTALVLGSVAAWEASAGAATGSSATGTAVWVKAVGAVSLAAMVLTLGLSIWLGSASTDRSPSVPAPSQAPAAVPSPATEEGPAVVTSGVAENAAVPAEAEPAPTLEAEAVTADALPEGIVGGIVVDEDAQPVPGAIVLLYHDTQSAGLHDAVVEQVTSGADGRFAFSEPLKFERPVAHTYGRDAYTLVAKHRDYALGWALVDYIDTTQTYRITLTAAASRTFTVVNAEGEPLEGAKVWMCAAGASDDSNPLFRHYLGFDSDADLASGLTDTYGRVTITNIPKTATSFYATLSGYADCWVASKPDTFVMTRGTSVSGRVVTDRGRGIPDAKVIFAAKWMHNSFHAQTDANGAFQFEDLPADGWDMSTWSKGKTGDGTYDVRLRVLGYSAPTIPVQLLPGETLEDFTITAYPATLVRCWVVDEETGEPVPGARIFGKGPPGRIEGFSDENGLFSIETLPGEVTLYYTSPPDGVYLDESRVNREPLTFQAEGEAVDVTLKAPHPEGALVTVKGHITNWDPGAMGDVVVYAAAGRFRTSTSSSYVRHRAVNGDGSFELSGVPAGRRMKMVAVDSEWSVAGVGTVDVPVDPNEPVEARFAIAPTKPVTITITNDAGDPLRGTRINVRHVVEDETIVFAERFVETDEKGQLHIDGVIPGLAYALWERPKGDDSGGFNPDALNTTMVLLPR